MRIPDALDLVQGLHQTRDIKMKAIWLDMARVNTKIETMLENTKTALISRITMNIITETSLTTTEASSILKVTNSNAFRTRVNLKTCRKMMVMK